MTNTFPRNKNAASEKDTTSLNVQINHNNITSEKQAEIGVLDAPGLVGQMAAYINEVSYKHQPLLAVAASIAAVGAIYGHRLQSTSDLRTNALVFALAESGAGKEGSRQAVRQLFDRLPDNLGKLMCGDPASAPGLLSALHRTGGVGLFLIDEVGHYLSGINNKNAQSHTAAIMPLLTKLFTSANTTYHGTEYSDRVKDKEQRTDIKQPCVCVLGSSVPDRIYTAINLNDICDGFLPRWLVLESDEISPETNQSRKKFDESSGLQVAQTIAQQVQILDERPDALPIEVPFAPEAEQILQKFREQCDIARIKAVKEDSQMKYIYTRSYEHAEKLALIACEYMDRRHIITRHSALWAIAVINKSNERMKDVISNVASSPHEQNLDAMLAIIRRRGKMSRKEFGNHCRKWKHKMREELLSDLRDAELVKEYKLDNVTYIEPV